MREDWLNESYSKLVDKVSTSKQKLKQKEYLTRGKYPIVDQGQQDIGGYTDDESKVLECELPVIVFGDHTKIVKLIGFPFAPGADGTKILQPKKFVLPKYLSYLTEILVFKIKDKGYARHYQHIEKENFPLAPLPEQREIVSKIEQLFSELDNGIANLKAAQDKLEIYRQAVLKKAFEGELTKQWREQQTDLPFVNALPETTLGDISNVATGATPKKSDKKYWDNGELAWVTSGSLNELFVNEPSSLITKQAIKETNCKMFPIGTLLVAMYGEGKTRGKCSELNIEAATNQAIAAILLKEEFRESKKYVKWFLLKNYKDIRLLSSGGVQPNLNLTKVKETKLPFPLLKEQALIVQKIESRLSVCDKLSDTIEEQLKKAEALRQSILKKAFEGRLLSDAEIEACKQEDDWEPADELLARIKAEKV